MVTKVECKYNTAKETMRPAGRDKNCALLMFTKQQDLLAGRFIDKLTQRI